MSRFLVYCCAVVAAGGWLSPAHAENNPKGSKQSAELKLLKALDSPTSFEFVEQPLGDAIDYLKEYHGIEIQFDLRALEVPGVSPVESTLSAAIKGVSLRSGLNLTLPRVDESLAFVIKDEVLLITTKPAAMKMVETRIYELTDEQSFALVQQMLQWRHSNQFAAAPEPAVTARGKSMIVSASLLEQDVVRAFLADLDRHHAAGPDSKEHATSERTDGPNAPKETLFERAAGARRSVPENSDPFSESEPLPRRKTPLRDLPPQQAIPEEDPFGS